MPRRGRFITYECEHCGLEVWSENGYTRRMLNDMHRAHFPRECPSPLARQIMSHHS